MTDPAEKPAKDWPPKREDERPAEPPQGNDRFEWGPGDIEIEEGDDAG